VHAFLDGRDVQPRTAPAYLGRLEAHLDAGQKGVIGTVGGRYWGMDRDNRWDRVERAYRAIVAGEAPRAASAVAGVLSSFDAGKTDEFVEPFLVGGYAGVDTAKDAALHTNFRPDRARELTRALASQDFDGFARRGPAFSHYACMTTYDTSLDLPVAFPKEAYPDIFPEVIARAGLTQFRCAETEKYAHVTYFFNGGREEPFVGEDRKMIPSPRDVATYDQKPQMSAREVAEAVATAAAEGRYDFILVNFANPDMVGHTGNLDAAIHAVDTVDAGLGRICEAILGQGGALVVTADHGNCELMKDSVSGEPHTAHTTNRVPLILVDDSRGGTPLRQDGRICDVAPTLLSMLRLAQPAAMTGRSLLDDG
jgi:2,3-bisphosphoglycerate-independent phosphoglycerate mutase